MVSMMSIPTGIHTYLKYGLLQVDFEISICIPVTNPAIRRDNIERKTKLMTTIGNLGGCLFGENQSTSNKTRGTMIVIIDAICNNLNILSSGLLLTVLHDFSINN
jgi:hypothetical protein